MSTIPVPGRLPNTSETPTTIVISSTCAGEGCTVNMAPTSDPDPVSESNVASPPAVGTEPSAEESNYPNSDKTRGTTALTISQSPSLTSSQPSTLVVTTIEPSPTGAASLQTEGAGPNGNSGLGAGAVAGIAVATLIAGAAIAFLATFFLFKRRDRTSKSNATNKAYNSYADSTPDFVMMQQQNNVGMAGRNSPYVQVPQTSTPRTAILPTPLPASTQQSESVAVAAYLPKVAPEGKVYNRVRELFNQCHSHIETYYRDVHASITPSMESDLAQFGAKHVNMAELLQECSSPITALKHTILAYVLGITAPSTEDSGETLFPDELGAIYNRDDHGDDVDPDVTAASTLHRRLSVYLFNAASPTTLSRRDLITDSNAHEAAEHFSLTFFPWANPSASDQERDAALASLIHKALQLNIWLYGEPFLYAFEWEETGRRGVLVSPSLVRRTDGADSSRDSKVVVEGVVMAA